MTVEKNQYGAWVVSEIIDGVLEHRQYYGYTKREAVAAFRAEIEAEKRGDA